MNEYDTRQAVLVLDRINAYQAGTLGLSRLVANLTGLAGVFEDVELGEQVLAKANDLELINGGLLFDDRQPDEFDRSAIDEILKQLAHLVRNAGPAATVA